MQIQEQIIYRITNQYNSLFRIDKAEFQKINDKIRNTTPGWKNHVSVYESTFLDFYIQSSRSPTSYTQFNKYLIQENENYLFGFNGKHSLFYSLGMDDDYYAKDLYLEQFKQIINSGTLKVDIYIGEVLAFTDKEVMFDITKVEHFETIISYERLISI